MILIGFLLALVVISGAVEVDWRKVEDRVNYYVGNGAFPGGVLRVANGTHTLYENAFGHFSHQSEPFSVPAFTNNTIFDIASLTKVSATLSAIMHLEDQQKLSIYDLVSKYIPEYANNGKQSTIIKNLLLHNAGLLPDHPNPIPKTKKQVMDFIYKCPLDYAIGTKFVYSDLSFILLGEISERITGKKLDVYVKELMGQMGMLNSTFLPNITNLDVYNQIAPTEYSGNTYFKIVQRRQLIRGEVHDPTAYVFGGVAGHAGFFTVVRDLETYMQIHLNKGLHRNGTRIYKEETVVKFVTRQDGLPYQNRRALGWDTVPIQTNPPCGNLFSLNSFGHTGYTGTMMWADRDKNLIVILLTNRVHPTSRNLMIAEARANIVDDIVRALQLN